MNRVLLILFLTLGGCIGEDIIDDFVMPQIRITNVPQSLAQGENYMIDAVIMDNVGRSTALPIQYKSSNEDIALIN